MHSLTREEEALLRFVLKDYKPGPCGECVADTDPLPDDLCDRLIERGLMYEIPCEVSDVQHCIVTAMGKLVLELTERQKAG
jgi:hypothetical protein